MAEVSRIAGPPSTAKKERTGEREKMKTMKKKSYRKNWCKETA